jgi:ATP-dependent Lon protease
MKNQHVEYEIQKLQKKYKLNIKKIVKINRKLTYFQDILIGFVNNINTCKIYNIFKNEDNYYLTIIDELRNIKNELKVFQTPLTLKTTYLLGGIDKVENKINNISFMITRILSIITPHNLTYIFQQLLGRNWVSNFTKSDIDKLIFLSQMFTPLTAWDTMKHDNNNNFNFNKREEFKKDEKSDTSTFDISKTNFTNILTKNLLDIFSDDEVKKDSGKNIVKFTNFDCEKVLNNDNVKIVKNPDTTCLIEEKFGARIYIKVKHDYYIIIHGIFKEDILNVSEMVEFTKLKLSKLNLKIENETHIVPKCFKDKFLKILSLRDLIIYSEDFLINELKKKHNEFKMLQGKSMLNLINEFLVASKYRKIDILTHLFMSDEENKKLGFILFDVLQTKEDRGLANEIYTSLHYSIREELEECRIEMKETESKLKKLTESDIPYEKRIMMMKSDDDTKSKAMEKLKSFKNNMQGDNKSQTWLDGLLKIPFGIYKENPILNFKTQFSDKINQQYPDRDVYSEHQINEFIKDLKNGDNNNSLIIEWEKYQDDKKDYINDCRKAMDSAVYGHKEAKIQIERVIAQWINGETKGAILGLEGPPGTGKTSLAKEGLSKCLKDEHGTPRPFVLLPIGGSTNGSTLVGHNFTYVGSTWGRIADILMSTQCMNPIIFIDEVDKISQTEYGRELVSILTHLTDPTQNDEFEDKYFAGIKLNLSKALIVFSFNDVDLLDPILRDRITIIKTNPLSIQEKKVIVQDYIFPQILTDVGFDKSEITIKDEIIEDIVEEYTFEAGVRKLKEKLFELVRDINLRTLKGDRLNLPYDITKEFCNELFSDKPKIRIKKIGKHPTIGLVNGLYATTAGIGGLTSIQVMKYPSNTMMEIHTTGCMGDTMKESVQYALKIAFSLLSTEQQDKILQDAQDKKIFGLHVHAPEAAQPKNGPSAGAAITLALYSVLTGIPINNEIAMTGEIDMMKNITAIGGVQSKLNGAKKAGAKLALIPKENMEDLEILRKDKMSPEDEKFKVAFIETIEDVLDHCLVK